MTNSLLTRSPHVAALLASTGLVAVAIAATGPAFAQTSNSCGPLVEGRVTCPPQGNPYAGGIRYETPTVQPGANIDDPATPVFDLAVALAPGVAVQLAPAAKVAGAVELSGRQRASVTLSADPSATVVTSGGQFGIAARTDAGAIDISAGSIATSSVAGGGISTNSQGGGNTTINVASITTSGNNANGIEAMSLKGGTAAITAGRIETAGAGASAIRLFGSAPGLFDVQTTGAVTTTGDGAHGLLATPGQAAVRLAMASVTTAGANADGVLIDDATGSVTATIGRASTSGVGSTAVFARTQGSGPITLDVTEAATRGDGASAILAAAMDGNATVRTAGAVSTAGTGTIAISASSNTGSAGIVAAGPVTTTGAADAIGVQAYVADNRGAASAQIADVSTVGTRSRAVIVSGGSASAMVTGQVSTTGQEATGVTVRGIDGGGRFTSSGSVTTGGTSAFGVDVRASGPVTIAGSGSIQTRGAGAIGLFAESNSDLTAAQGTIVTAGAGAAGASLVTSARNLSFSFDRLSTEGDAASGVYARTGAGGTLRGTVGAVATSGNGSRGIDLTGGGALVLRATTAATAGTGAEAVFAFMAGDTDIAVGTANTSGMGSRGVAAASVLGNLTVSLGNGVAAGVGSTLVDISAPQGSAGLTSTGTLSVTGPRSALVVVRSGTDARASIADARISGAESAGIRVEGGNSGNVSVTGTVTDSANASGFTQVVAVSGGSQATVTNTGTISATGTNTAGILASSPGAVTIGGIGTVSTTGNGAYGVQAAAVSGPVSVMQGIVATSGNAAAGVIARSNDTVRVGLGTVTTAGNDSAGILVEGRRDGIVTAGTVTTRGGGASAGIIANVSGNATVTAGTVSVQSGTANAILARGASASVIATGTVTAAGSGTAAAIQVSAGTGPAVANVASVNGSGSGRVGVFAESATSANVAVSAGGTVTGTTDAIVLAGRTTNALVNDGVVMAGTGAALRVSGGSASIDNRGTIRGPLILSGVNDTVTNSGELAIGAGTQFGAGDDSLSNTGIVTLSGPVDFGAGADTFANAGTLRLAAASTARSVALLGLERFVNSGTIALADGVTGDVLTIPGAYSGTGNARLTLDVRADASLADRLSIGGAASGATAVAVALGDGPVRFGQAVTLIQAGAGTNADAFSLADASHRRGLIDFALSFDPAANRFNLISAPSASALRVVKIGEGLQSLSYVSGDAVLSQLKAWRDAVTGDAAARGSRLWGQMFGHAVDRDQDGAVDSGSFRQTVNYGYRQDDFGFQLGVDLLSSASLSAGVTAGYQNSTLRFRGVPERFTVDALNVGGYAGVRAGPAFLNLVAKYDRYLGTYHLPAFSVTQDMDGEGFGARAEAGVRLGGENFFAEPRIGLAYAHTNIDRLVAGGLTLDLADLDGLRGNAGLRIGHRTTLPGGSIATVYAGADAVHEFQGRDKLLVSTGLSSLSVRDERIGTYGRGQLGVSIGTGQVSGFIQAEGTFSDDYRGGGGRAGLRIGF